MATAPREGAMKIAVQETREGKLADVRRRCRKRQHVSRRHVERRRRCDKMQRNNQPALTKRGGSRMDARGGCATKGDARRRSRDKRRRDNQPANRGRREEMRQRTRCGGVLISRGCGGGRVERTRGGGVNTTTSRQTRDNHGDGKGEGDGDGDGKCRTAAITGLGKRPPRSSRLRLWMRSRWRRRRPWASRLRLRPRSRRTTPRRRRRHRRRLCVSRGGGRANKLIRLFICCRHYNLYLY